MKNDLINDLHCDYKVSHILWLVKIRYEINATAIVYMTLSTYNFLFGNE